MDITIIVVLFCTFDRPVNMFFISCKEVFFKNVFPVIKSDNVRKKNKN